MKPKTLLVRLLVCVALGLLLLPLARPANAATTAGNASGTGTIVGRVQNVVTGNYLNKARVSIQGTNQMVLTDESGAYQLVEVRPGAAVLNVFYTDLDPVEVAVSVRGGETVVQNVQLTSATRYGKNVETVKLDPFVVFSARETDNKAIATNEQRFSPNIKNVMATDALGNIMGSDVGEFLKFMPGLQVENSNDLIVGILVRGIPGDKTAFMSDGSPIANSGNDDDPRRSFNMSAIALSSLARIEVTKVPTPSAPADSMGGTVNLITKSAFERDRAELKWGVNLVANSENLTFAKTPFTIGDRNTRKILPGYDFSYTTPIGKNFGLVFAGSQNDRYSEQHIAVNTGRAVGTGTGLSAATPANPYLLQYTLQDGPTLQSRTAYSLKVDWRVLPHSVLSLSAQYNSLKSYLGNSNFLQGASNNGTPTPATGTPASFGPDFIIGATGRGTVTQQVSDQSKRIDSRNANLGYRFDDGKWMIDARLSAGVSVRRRPTKAGFGNVQTSLRVPVRVSLLDLGQSGPGRVQVFDNANQPVDIFNIANHQISGATITNYNTRTLTKSASLNLQRSFDVLPFPTSLKIGGYRGIRDVDSRRSSAAQTFGGPDGVASTIDPVAPYLAQVYVNQYNGWGWRNIPWVSTDRAWEAWQANSVLFSQTPAQQVATETSRITGSEHLEEVQSALYAQVQARFLNNRLTLVTGVRFEKTQDVGEGALVDPNAVFVRNADGTFAHTSAGAKIRKPEAGAAGTMQELLLIRKERGFRANRPYQGYYPSVNLTYNIRDNFLARLGYAKTYARPNFNEIIPNVTINEADLSVADSNNPSIVQGTLTLRNPALKPWTANNFDLSLEYYTEQGGVISGGVFDKQIKDFWATETRIATASQLEFLGLDPEFVGWNINTRYNAGRARIKGAELSFDQSLRQLGRWGSYFTVFANYTRLWLSERDIDDFQGFVGRVGNWGVTFSKAPFMLSVKTNYRGQSTQGVNTVTAPDAFSYFKARTRTDVEASYQLTKRLSLGASVTNLLNIPQTLLVYGTQTPEYAKINSLRRYGIGFALGIRGTY